jgi:hypothetical protein
MTDTAPTTKRAPRVVKDLGTPSFTTADARAMYVGACERVYPGVAPPRVSREFLEQFERAMYAALKARAQIAQLLRSGSGKTTLRAADFSVANGVTVSLPPEARLKPTCTLPAVAEEPKKVARRPKKAAVRGSTNLAPLVKKEARRVKKSKASAKTVQE